MGKKCISGTTTIEHLEYLESIDALNEIFNEQIGFEYKMTNLDEKSYHPFTWGHQSYYCEPSPTGRKHEADFTATKIVKILDTNTHGIIIESDWDNAVINEVALRNYVEYVKLQSFFTVSHC